MPELPPLTIRLQAGRWPVLVLISVFLLMLTVSWSLYDEFFGLRPWRKYQSRILQGVFQLSGQSSTSSARRPKQKFYATPEYQKLLADVKAATDAAQTQDQQIGQADRSARSPARGHDATRSQTSRGQVGALTYQLETNRRERQEREGIQARRN